MNTKLSNASLGRGKFPLRRGGRAKFSRGGSKFIPKIMSTSVMRGRGRGRSSSFAHKNSRGGRNIVRREVIRGRGGNFMRRERMEQGFEFGGRNVYVEDDDEFENTDEGNIDFGFKESYEDSPVHFVEEQRFNFSENPNEDFDEDFEDRRDEERRSLERSRKEGLEKELFKLDRERVKDMMYEEEQKRFENERKTVEKERKDLENLRKTIEMERRKVENLKKKVEEEEREEQRARSLSLGRDSKHSYSERLDEADIDNDSCDDSFANPSSRQSSVLPESFKKNLLNKTNTQKRLTTCSNDADVKTPLLKTPSGTGEYCPTSNRMTAAGFLKFVNKQNERRNDEGHNNMSRKDQLTSVSTIRKPFKESKGFEYGEKSNKRSFDIMQGPRRPDFSDSSRGTGHAQMVGRYRPELEQNRGRQGLNEGQSSEEFTTKFGGYPQGPRNGRFNEGVSAEFHDNSRGRFNSNQGVSNFNQNSNRGRGFVEDSRGSFYGNQRGGFNELSRGYCEAPMEKRYEDISRGGFESESGHQFKDGHIGGGEYNDRQRMRSEFSDGQRKRDSGFIDGLRGNQSSVQSWGLDSNSRVGGFRMNQGRGGFNDNSRREFNSNFNTGGVEGIGLNQRSFGGGGFFADNNQSGFRGMSESGQANQYHRGNFPEEISNLDTVRNQRMGREEMPMAGSMMNSTSFNANERGYRNPMNEGLCATSSRSFRENEYHYKGGESSSNFPNMNFGQFQMNKPNYESAMQAEWNAGSPELSHSDNEFMNMDGKPKPFHGKRTDDERFQRILQRKKKKLLITQSKLRPKQAILKVKIEKELEEIEIVLRKVSEKCFNQRQLAKMSDDM